MTSKIIAILIVIIALGAGIAFLLKPAKDDSVLTPDPAGFLDNSPVAVTVVMDGEKFIPEMVTIKKGEKVRWINQDTNQHWPASDLHPTHAIYPEFDPLEGVPPGKSWTFAFTKIGTWKYHDHLHPLTRGVIEVK